MHKFDYEEGVQTCTTLTMRRVYKVVHLLVPGELCSKHYRLCQQSKLVIIGQQDMKFSLHCLLFQVYMYQQNQKSKMSPSITSMWISDVQIPVRGYLVFCVHNTNNSLMFLSVTSFSNGRRTKCSDMAEFTKPFSIRLGKQIEAKCLTICIYKVTKSFLSNFVKSFLKENKHMQG